jgi:hypothetical protein
LAWLDSALRDWFVETTGWRDAVLPAYDGSSIANLPASVLNGLGISPAGRLLPALDPELLDPSLLDGARTIVLIVLDACGVAARARVSGTLGACTRGAFVQRQLTSVFPSTTAAALTSLQTGVAPGTHGLAGYTLHIPSVNKLINMVTFKPVDSANGPSPVDPGTFLPVPTIYDLVRDADGDAVVVSHREYQRSPLTQIHSGDTPYRGHRTLAEFVHLLREETLRPSDRGRFVFGYWAGLDMLAHAWGPESPVCDTETAILEDVLQREFLEPIAEVARDVAVIVTADHGQATVPEAEALPLHRLVAATGGWRRPPTGERRAVGVSFTNAEQRASVRSRIGASGVVLDVSDAIEQGLYGPGPRHPELGERIGDALLLARGRRSFPFRPPKEGAEVSLGGHGSLTANEMLVPLLVWRF